MSSHVVSALGALAVGLGVLAATTQGCGGGGGAGSGTATDVCDRFCDKRVACGVLPSQYGAECRSSCPSSGASAAGAASMTNCPGLTADQAVAMVDGCLAATCGGLNACLAAACPVGSGGAGGTGIDGAAGGAGTGGADGAAGAGGAGGASGAGGAAGSMCERVCTKANACCAALQAPGDGGTNCMSQADCNAAGADMAKTQSDCNALLQTSALLGVFAPAACK